MVISTKGLKLGKTLVWLSVIALICYFLLQAVAEQKIRDLIAQKSPEKFALKYENIRLNLLSRSLTLEGVVFNRNSQDSLGPNLTLTLKAVKARNIDFITLMNKENIEIGILEVEDPDLKMVQDSLKNNDQKNKQDLPKITIESLQITNARVNYVGQSRKDTLLSLGNGMAFLKNVQLDKESTQILTLDTTSVQFNAKNLKLKLTDYENLNIESMQITNTQFFLENLNLKTRFNKEAYSRKLHFERDHYDLLIPKTEGIGLRWPTTKGKVRIVVDSLIISQMDCSIFRDKTLPDDTTPKTYFMESISQLDFPLHLPKVRIADAKLSYSEKTEKSNSPQPLVFSSIKGDLVNISNQNERTLKIQLNSKLMEKSPLELKLDTYASMPLKNFVCTGKLYNFSANDISPFLSTNMGVRTKGNVEEMYFTISGNRQGALGDMKMKYDDFEFEILKKDLLGVRKTTSFILNLLVNRGNRTDENGFRYGEIKVKPETSKSFTNYLWNCVRDGLLDTVTGSGKRS